MSIVKNTNKKTGITYVYESESYWCPELKQPRNRRKLIGKLDEAGNIVPTGKRGRKSKEEKAAEPEKLAEELQKDLLYYQDECRKKETEITLLQERIRTLEKEKTTILHMLGDILEKYQ